MKLDSPVNDSRYINYNSESFENLLSETENEAKRRDFHLLLMVGQSKERKQDALNEIKKRTGRDFQQVDANELISANEAETCRRIDELLENYSSNDTILHMTNGGNLCGAFTGYTLSKVKYATPQERYFLKSIQQAAAFVIIDFESLDHIDTTLKRASHAIITFPVPDSGLKGLMARLKQIHVNGYDLSSKRPVHGGRSAGNF